MGMMKFKVRFRSEKGAFGFQRLDLCFLSIGGGHILDRRGGVIWEETKISFYSSFFGSSDNDEERRINRGMYEWH